MVARQRLLKDMDLEKRRSLRKALVSSGRLRSEAAAPLSITTINLAADGIAISASGKVFAGTQYTIDFEIVISGKPCPVTAVTEAMFCVYAGDGVFKAGLKFMELDPHTASLISQFLTGH
jgi:hypothetical protein